MAKLDRKNIKLFGRTGPTSDFGQFGSLALGAGVLTKDIEEIQDLEAYDTGWAAEIISNNRPALEDFNGLHYVQSYGLSYLYENGIAEWNAETTYYQYSLCRVNGVTYMSRTNDNLNNSPASSATNWKVHTGTAQGANVASVSSMTLGNDGDTFTITGTTNINNITIKPADTVIKLIFSGILTVGTGGNILLTGGSFTTAANSTLMLVSNGTGWIELSRSPIKAVLLTGDQTIAGVKTFTDGIDLGGTGSISNGTLGKRDVGSITITTDNTPRYVPDGAYVIGGLKQSDGNFTTLYYAYP